MKRKRRTHSAGFKVRLTLDATGRQNHKPDRPGTRSAPGPGQHLKEGVAGRGEDRARVAGTQNRATEHGMKFSGKKVRTARDQSERKAMIGTGHKKLGVCRQAALLGINLNRLPKRPEDSGKPPARYLAILGDLDVCTRAGRSMVRASCSWRCAGGAGGSVRSQALAASDAPSRDRGAAPKRRTSVLEAAVKVAGHAPEILNTGQICQFTCGGWTVAAQGHDIRVSMDGKDRRMNNVFIERLWRSLKCDGIYPTLSNSRVWTSIGSKVLTAKLTAFEDIVMPGPTTHRHYPHLSRPSIPWWSAMAKSRSSSNTKPSESRSTGSSLGTASSPNKPTQPGPNRPLLDPLPKRYDHTGLRNRDAMTYHVARAIPW